MVDIKKKPADVASVCRALTELSEILDEHHNRREEVMKATLKYLNYVVALVGILAIAVLLFLFYMVKSIDENMDVISHEMHAIGKTMPSMLYMANNMQNISNAMLPLDDSVRSINSQFITLNESINSMNRQIIKMQQQMDSLPLMQQNVQTMTQIVAQMQMDMGVMRQGIYHIDQTFAPMRMMGGMLP